jgi:cytochrome c oxidase assembly protein subunit 15
MTNPARAVANWVLIGIIMLLIQVVLGGVTRLTGSGLSITEWNVISGFKPPLNESEWAVEFNKYKETPQYKLINTHFTLRDFKFIFFWEWMHRYWARLIGIVFIVGFIYLLARRAIVKEMVAPLLTLFFLGALQGAVGWIMVASGLTGDAVYVKPTRLALHFIFAIGLIAYAFWFYLVLIVRRNSLVKSTNVRGLTSFILVLTVVQLIFGALMAGHKAATAAPTWPDINGSFVPAGLMREVPAVLNFIDNKITIHFVHRNLAYLILILTVILTVRLYKINSSGTTFNISKATPILLVAVQILLGVLSLLTSTGIQPNRWGNFEWFAQLHQVTGLLFALSLVALLYLVRRR